MCTSYWDTSIYIKSPFIWTLKLQTSKLLFKKETFHWKLSFVISAHTERKCFITRTNERRRKMWMALRLVAPAWVDVVRLPQTRFHFVGGWRKSTQFSTFRMLLLQTINYKRWNIIHTYLDTKTDKYPRELRIFTLLAHLPLFCFIYLLPFFRLYFSFDHTFSIYLYHSLFYAHISTLKIFSLVFFFFALVSQTQFVYLVCGWCI